MTVLPNDNNRSENDQQEVVKALTKYSFESLLPLPHFRRFERMYGAALRDDPKYLSPVYPDFVDFNYKHATSPITPIYLNDFDFNLEEDREKLIKLIRSDFKAETFMPIAQCQCSRLKGNYLLGSDRICEVCQTKVEDPTLVELATKVWLRKPTGVDTFINPGLYNTYLKSISMSSPKIEIITYIIDSKYRRSIVPGHKQKIAELRKHLLALDVELNINGFYRKADSIMEYFLLGPGKVITSLNTRESEKIYEHYLRYKHVIFCDYIPVPNKLSVIVEQSGKDKYAVNQQLKSNSVYEAIASQPNESEFNEVTQEDIEESIDRVGRSVREINELRMKEMKEYAFPKKGVFRKHVCSGSMQLTSRGVITSRTGIIDPREITIPWIMAMAQLHPFILSHLYRLGYSPLDAERKIIKSSKVIDPDIDKFLAHHESLKDIIGKAGRMPSIQYLSRRAFYIRINRDLSDESIKLPILTCSDFNADFDGDQMTVFIMGDLRSKIAAYGAFGHQSAFDTNTPFKISRHLNQTSTVLVNTNNVMQKTEFL